MSLWSNRPVVRPSYPGQVNFSKHTNYPHRAGELYDCPMCEGRCYCTDEFSCLHCELAAETLREEC